MSAAAMTAMEASNEDAEVAGRGLADVSPANSLAGAIPQKMVGAVKMPGATGMAMPAKPIGGAIDIKDAKAKLLPCKACGPVVGKIISTRMR